MRFSRRIKCFCRISGLLILGRSASIFASSSRIARNSGLSFSFVLNSNSLFTLESVFVFPPLSPASPNKVLVMAVEPAITGANSLKYSGAFAHSSPACLERVSRFTTPSLNVLGAVFPNTSCSVS